MADNFTTPVPDGVVLAAKDVGGVHYPRNLLTDETGTDAMGEVGASPDANTILGRLKAIADGVTILAGHVDGLEGLATALNGFVDGVETLIGTTNTSLSNISGFVDGLETLATALNGYVDGIETLITSTNTKLDSLAGFTDGIEALITTLNGYVDGLEALQAKANATQRILSAAATTNATSVKGSAGTLKGIQGYNASVAGRYLKLYNKATAPTVGTDTPVKTIYLPPETPFSLQFDYAFSTGIGLALTVGGADNDATALTSGDILGLNVDYV